MSKILKTSSLKSFKHELTPELVNFGHEYFSEALGHRLAESVVLLFAYGGLFQRLHGIDAQPEVNGRLISGC